MTETEFCLAFRKAALERREELELLSSGLEIDLVMKLARNVFWNFPELFFLDYNGVTFYSSGGKAHSIRFSYLYSEKEQKEMSRRYEETLSEAVKGVRTSWCELEKVLYIHDYLALHTSYRYENESSCRKLVYTAYGALVHGEAVCAGYARAFMAMAMRLGLSAAVVESDKLNHEWNIIKIGGCYYHLDVTWNDPLLGGHDIFGGVRHVFFLKSSKAFRSCKDGENHHDTPDWNFSIPIRETEVSSEIYDRYFWEKHSLPLIPIAERWYSADDDGTVWEYSFRENRLSSGRSLFSIKDRWQVPGDPHQYYVDQFPGIAGSGGYLFCSDSERVFAYDPKTGKKAEYLRLTSEEKKKIRIYRIMVQNGALVVNKKQDPGAENHPIRAAGL